MPRQALYIVFWGYPWMIDAHDQSKIFQMFNQKKISALVDYLGIG